MYIDSLILEVTRRCNLTCEHCCRGAVQRLDMSADTLNSVMSYVSGIGSVTFTGGEPSLVPEFLDHFLDQCRRRHLSYQSFYLVTNGKTRNGFKRFLHNVNRLYEWADEKEACCLSCSLDQFHKEQHTVGMSKFADQWGEFPPYFDPKSRDMFIREPINEGRAKQFGYGTRTPEEQEPWIVAEYTGTESVTSGQNNSLVYVSANGNVVSDCNMSFRRIDQEAKGNINYKPLPEIIHSFCIPYEE